MRLSCGNPLALAALQGGQTVLDLDSGGGSDAFQAGVKGRLPVWSLGWIMPQKTLQQPGFTDIYKRTQTKYIHQLQDPDNPLYESIAKALPKGAALVDYVVNLTLAAHK